MKSLIFFLILPGVILEAGCEGCADRRPTPHQAAMERRRRLRLASLESKRPKEKKEVRLIHDTEVTVAIPYMPLHLNPLLKISEWGYRIAMGNVFEPLVEYDPATGRIRPRLCEAWDVDPSGRIYRFTIRAGLRWQDGRPMTAEDVRFTFAVLQSPRIRRGPFLRDIMYDLQRVDVVDERTVRVVLRNPNVFFLERVSELPILPSHLYARAMSPRSRLSRRPIGSGPYRFLERKGSKEIVLIRNEFYWGPAPEVTRIVFRVYDEDSKALVAVRRRELDIMPDVPASYYPEQFTPSITSDYAYMITDVPDFGYIIWNTRDPILGDFRIRRVLTMLIDRRRIVERIFHGLASVPKGPFFPPSGWGDPDLKPWPYDSEKARKMLTDMGWVDTDGDGIRDKGGRQMKLVMLYPVDSHVGERILGMIKDEFVQSGIAVVVLPTAWKMMFQLLKKGKFSGAFLAWRGRPREDFTQLFHSAGKYNFGVISNIFLDKTLSRLRRGTGDPRELSAKIERILHAYMPVTFLYRLKRLVLYHKRLGHVRLTPLGMDFRSMTVDRKYWLRKAGARAKDATGAR